MSTREIIVPKAIDIIKEYPDGIRWSDLLRKMVDEFPTIRRGTIKAHIIKFFNSEQYEVYKPERGLFRHTMFKEEKSKIRDIDIIPKTTRVREEDFYQPFADWLVNDLEECTEAIPLGGNKFKDKWGTPDVIGKRESRRSDIIKAPTEIISAEIKIDTLNLITAFGQACSYKLFSHKSYIVIPKESSNEDIARIDALCRIYGIGLILFNSNNPDDPQFEIRARSSKHEPDMFYVNKYMKLIESDLFR